MRTQLVEIDLRNPINPIYIDSRYQILRVLGLWGNIPLGLVDFELSSGLRVLSEDRILGEILKTIGSQIWKQAICGDLAVIEVGLDEEPPPISVVVCTRDRPLSLHRCLESLQELDYPKYEVVVIDNHSKGNRVQETVVEFGFKYCREDNLGLDRARNRGIRESEYDIIAFIDDDALASPGWLGGLAKGFYNPAVMCVTGLVLPAEIETKAQFEFELYGGMSKGFKPFTIRYESLLGDQAYWASSWGVGTNMAFRRSLFETIGFFDEALDVGTPTNGGGDLEFLYRTVSAGFVLRYEPAGYVRHVHRRDNAALKKQMFNNGRSFLAYLITIASNTPGKRFSIAWFAVRGWLWNWLVKRIIISILKLDIMRLELSLAELSGAFTGVAAYQRSHSLVDQMRVG